MSAVILDLSLFGSDFMVWCWSLIDPLPPLTSLSLHGSSGPHHGPREQHGRRPAGENHHHQRCNADRHGEPRRPVLPERKRPDGEERTRLWGDYSRIPTLEIQFNINNIQAGQVEIIIPLSRSVCSWNEIILLRGSFEFHWLDVFFQWGEPIRARSRHDLFLTII